MATDLKQLLEQQAGIIRGALAQTDQLSFAANLLSISPQSSNTVSKAWTEIIFVISFVRQGA